MITTDSLRGRVALMVAHCAGMVDLVALPLWVGSLMGHFRFDAQQAGGVVTLFLVGAVLASSVLAPRFGRLLRRGVATVGFGIAALAFFGASLRTDVASMAILHAVAGLSTGAALCVTHGSIARSARPHRLFAIVGTALGAFAVAFFALVPALMANLGGTVLFHVFAGVMGFAAVMSLLAFPQMEETTPAVASTQPAGRPPRLSRAVWFGIVGIGCMGLVQSMVFAFMERVGNARGFEGAAIATLLVVIGIINLFPAPLAALLERQCQARHVMLAGPVAQAVMATAVTLSASFASYAAGAAFFAAVIIFTHTFAFGLLARLEPSGRALAATPAMLMTGAAIGPVLGGTLVKAFGYGSLAMAAAAIAAFAVFCFSQLPAQTPVATRSALA